MLNDIWVTVADYELDAQLAGHVNWSGHTQ